MQKFSNMPLSEVASAAVPAARRVAVPTAKPASLSAEALNIPRSGIRDVFDRVERVPDAISLTVGEPSATAAPHIVAAACEAAQAGRTRYANVLGIPEYRKAVADYSARVKGLTYDPETEIQAVDGATIGLFLALKAVVGTGDEVIIPSPFFTSYDAEVMLCGGRPVTVCYYTQEALRVLRNDSFEGKTVVISGSGNVATYAAQKAEQLGAKVVTVSDSNGYIYDPNGINVEVVKQIKEVERGRIKEYAERVPGSEYHEGSKGVWTVKGDIALPCATQNEVDGESAQKLVDNGVTVVVEGANMPSTPEAIEVYQKNGVLYGPAKAANAGGVAVSGLEMSQNSYRLSWTFEEVDAKLKSIMEEIVANSLAAAKEYGHEGDLMLGANAAGFVKVANAMVAQGVL